MNATPTDFLHWLTQLRSIPVANEAVSRARGDDGNLRLSASLHRPGWAETLGLLLPISKEKNVELDRLGAEIFALCDGTRTVEQIIDLHKDRWRLSFFESRAMVLSFLQHLMRHNFIAMVAPSADELAERLAKLHIHPTGNP